jgi:hypothetical protein
MKTSMEKFAFGPVSSLKTIYNDSPPILGHLPCSRREADGFGSCWCAFQWLPSRWFARNKTNPWCSLYQHRLSQTVLASTVRFAVRVKGGKCVPQSACYCSDKSADADSYLVLWQRRQRRHPSVPRSLPRNAHQRVTEGCGIAAEYKCGYGNVCNTTVARLTTRVRDRMSLLFGKILMRCHWLPCPFSAMPQDSTYTWRFLLSTLQRHLHLCRRIVVLSGRGRKVHLKPHHM